MYITDNYTGNIIAVKNVTETQFTFDTSQDCSCSMYQVSAWNAGGEGELSEPVQRCIPHSKLLIFLHLPNKDTAFLYFPSSSEGSSWQRCYTFNRISSVTC